MHQWPCGCDCGVHVGGDRRAPAREATNRHSDRDTSQVGAGESLSGADSIFITLEDFYCYYPHLKFLLESHYSNSCEFKPWEFKVPGACVWALNLLP